MIFMMTILDVFALVGIDTLESRNKEKYRKIPYLQSSGDAMTRRATPTDHADSGRWME